MSQPIIVKPGVYPTMITPYTKAGEIDYAMVEKLVDWYAQKGCRGIFAVCQSSEMVYLSLKERVKLAKTVVDAADGRMDVVASGHVSDSPEAQAEEVNAVAETGAKAVVLVSNRLDVQKDGDKVWIERADTLLSRIPEDLPLGIYECPMPYKRLLTEEIMDWMIATRRFAFIKDTCCDPIELTRRLKQLEGTGVGLFNANEQTLLHSLKAGAFGYSGVMANFHPELLVWLCDHWQSEPEKAEKLQNYLSLYAFTEQLAYPCTAKYRLQLEGLPMEIFARSRDQKELTEYHRLCIRQARDSEADVRRLMGI